MPRTAPPAEFLNSTNCASDKQLAWVADLLRTRQAPETWVAKASAMLTDGMTKRQASAIISAFKDLPRQPQQAPQPGPAQMGGHGTVGQRQAPQVDVPAGRYAVDTEAGHLAFYRVDRPTEGRWAGYTFVKVQASDELHPVRGAAAKAVLAKIAVDPQGAMLRYGQEIGACGAAGCGRTLTNETSRKRGIGPKCAQRMGW